MYKMLKRTYSFAFISALVAMGFIIARTLWTGTVGIAMPHRYCLNNQSLVLFHMISDAAIGISYMVISTILIEFIRRAGAIHIKVKQLIVDCRWILLAFACFIFTCGLTHFMEVVTLWVAAYWCAFFIKAACAIASIVTAAALPSAVEIILVALGNRDDHEAVKSI